MELLLDTANVEEIKKYCDLYEIKGVTTNPTILSSAKGGFLSYSGRQKNHTRQTTSYSGHSSKLGGHDQGSRSNYSESWKRCLY